MNAREFLEHEASRLCLEINRHLAEVARAFGFDRARDRMGPAVEELAPGWEYVDTTTMLDMAPTIALSQYRGDEN
jgi:hypothetical protein